MSEPLLKAILRLFAVVAHLDKIRSDERNQVLLFLEDHVSRKSTDHYLDYFDQYVSQLPESFGASEGIQLVTEIVDSVGADLTQKQKVIIVLELINIIEADGHISPHEQELIDTIAARFRISQHDKEAIEKFVTGSEGAHMDVPHVLVVDHHTDSGRYKLAKHLVRKNLNGFIGILYLSEANLYFLKYLGESDLYLNGVPVKPGRIHVLAIGSLLRWDKDEPVYYGDILNHFKSVNQSPRLSFEARNISYTFKNGRVGLRNVHLAEESGNLVALMGASGAGKSTLLHVLNGSEKPSSGEVLINGINIHQQPDKIEGVIGFVPQDDLLIEDLTVYQNLYYSAKLCFDNKSEAEIDELIMHVLEDLGLEEIRDLKVGSPLRKTISGGQRKRLNIGLELLREPAVLFCDEPTSGLSSRDSENIIDLLKELSLKGKLVFAVIHQPSSDIYKMFDKLLILDTGGYQIYYGNPVDAVVYFKHAIHLVNSEEGECHECGNVNPEQIFNIIETKVINEYGQFTNERKITPEQWEQSYRQKFRIPEVATVNDVPHSTLAIPPRIKQTRIFSLRDLQAKIHNRQYMIINLLEAPVLAFILAYIVRYYNTDDQVLSGYVFSKNLNIPAYLFMSTIVALFMGLTVSAEEIIRDRKILKREAFLHLSRSSYLMSKISILFLLSAIQTATFVMVGNAILEIKGLFWEHWFILFTTSCFANVLGLNISSAFNSPVTIYILIPLLLIPQLILSGVVVKFDKLNPSIGNAATVPFVGDLMASRWAFEAAMVSQYKDNDFDSKFYLYDKTMAMADYKKVYYIPELDTRVQFCLQNLHSTDPDVKQEVDKAFALLRTELGRELEITGQSSQWIGKLNRASFNQQVHDEIIQFLDRLKRFYVNRFNAAELKKDALVNEMTSSSEGEKQFNYFREVNHNEAVAELVKNIAEPNRIIESDGKLIQKIYPIYKDPDPDHAIDFDAQFYMPSKHFLNKNIDTLYFNTGVIWSMSLFLVILLYFDVLRRIIDGIGGISNPLPRK